MSRIKLNLSGIFHSPRTGLRPLSVSVSDLSDLSDLSDSGVGVSRHCKENSVSQVRSQVRSQLRQLSTPSILYSALIIIGMTSLWCLYHHVPRARHLRAQTRQIHRIDCIMLVGEFECNSKYTTGTFHLKTSPDCLRYMYDVNHKPFVRIAGFSDGMFAVAARPSVIVRDARAGCALTAYWTNEVVVADRYVEYKTVWVTTRKHTEFTMVVDGVQLLERAPAEMLLLESNGEWVAYGSRAGGTTVVVTGDSTDIIHIYGDKST
jgi:hypothetical protein